MEKMKIAIDGPAASGKTTAGLLLARRLGFIFFDTGIMYRVITWAALEKGIDVLNEEEVSKLARDLKIEIKPPSKKDGRVNDVIVCGKDVTLEIRNSLVNQNVSQVSTYFGVRESLTRKQRSIADAGSIVMAGRDIGTVVLPEADYKFYLDASVEVRAERRKHEINEDISKDEIIKSVLRRDEIDTNREIAPLKPAEDAVIINTDNKTLDEVVEEMASIILSGNTD